MGGIYSSALLALTVMPAAAYWRLPCKSPLVVERADPIISPGAMSAHVHTIMGGNGFGLSMDYSSTQQSTCTSCTVHGDFSNYWTPTLWYRHPNGSFEAVHQVGGATVYYLQRRANDTENLQAFPAGFRMVAGDPFKRSAGTDFPSQAISYNCLDYNLNPPHPETGGFPNYNCPDGLRSQVFFPSCWDGENLDSPDHKSHVSYPIQNYNGGGCPDSHPVHLISIFYEIIWDTNKFASMWYGNSQPFVWSMGDPTGYGYHGDFLMGWDRDLLQRAVDTCTNDSGRVEDCAQFTLYPDATAEQCTQAPKFDEAVSGVLSALPGCNPVNAGPGEASPATCSGGSSTLSSSPSKSPTSSASFIRSALSTVPTNPPSSTISSTISRRPLSKITTTPSSPVHIALAAAINNDSNHPLSSPPSPSASSPSESGATCPPNAGATVTVTQTQTQVSTVYTSSSPPSPPVALRAHRNRVRHGDLHDLHHRDVAGDGTEKTGGRYDQRPRR